MTDPDRGAYTPETDAPLAFDARERSGSRGGATTLIVSAVLLVVLVGAVFAFYRGGIRGPNAPPQPVGTPIGAIKTPPPASADGDDATASLDVYKTDESAASTAPVFAKPPEQPLPRLPSAPVMRVEAAPLPAAEPAGPPPPPPAAAGFRPAGPAPAPLTPKPVAAAPKPAAPKPVAPVAKPATVAAPGSAMVQIGAFSSEALASQGLSDVTGAYAGAAAGRRIEPVASNGGTLYRGLITGFASHDAAASYCAKLKAGGRSCLVK